MNELRFDGKSIIITGAGRGVGRCLALDFAARGAQVVVADLGVNLSGTGSSNQPALEVVEEISAAGGKAVTCFANVADPKGADSIIKTAIDSFGKIDVVVNNAGIAVMGNFEELAIEDFQRHINVHYWGTLNVLRSAWSHVVAAKGRIVNTCSEAPNGTVPKASCYGGAKGGVFGLTRAISIDATRCGIAVNGVMPRAKTRMSTPEVLSHTYDLPKETFVGSMDKFGPELAAVAQIYLAHPSCPFNGEILVCGAGQVLRLVIMETVGITKENITPEDIAASIDQVMSMDNAQLITTGTLTA